ncbi:MAG: NADH-quinone oxidoreductase subunit N [Gemmatimonadota bacterium]
MVLDFTHGAHFLWALLPELILSVGGMAVLLAGVWKGDEFREGQGGSLGMATLVVLLLAALANGWLYGVSEVDSQGMVALDGFRLFGNWIFLLAAAFAVVISQDYVERHRMQVGEFYGLILLSVVGMMFMVGTRDLIVLFLGLETMSIAVYVLTAFNRKDRRSAEAGLKYFILGAFASGFLLYGIALLYGATGSTNISRIGEAVATGAHVPVLLTVGMLLLLVGFFFKVSAVPFHMWTPDVYEGAPTPVTAFMAAGVKAAGFLAFLRVLVVALPALYASWYPVMWWLAAITMVVANLVALAQPNVKRMLAYSSIAHGGYLMVALAAANTTASAGLLFYLLVYIIMNMGAFGVVMLVGRFTEERVQLDDYAGFGWREPMLGVFLTIFLLSLAGFPGTGGFMGKIYLLQGAAEAGLWSLAVVLALTTVVSYFYYLRVAWYMWMRDARSQEETDFRLPVPLPLRWGLGAAVAVVLFTGVLPGPVVRWALSGVESLTLVSGQLLALLP